MLGLVQIIAAAAGQPVRVEFKPPRAGELQRSVLDVGRAARDLGWAAETGLVDGIRDVYRWIEAGAPADTALPAAV